MAKIRVVFVKNPHTERVLQRRNDIIGVILAIFLEKDLFEIHRKDPKVVGPVSKASLVGAVICLLIDPDIFW